MALADRPQRESCRLSRTGFVYRSANQIAKISPTISTADAGIRSRAFFNRSGSPPAMAPMMRELTARPAHPQVITKPMAVPGSAETRGGNGQRGGEHRRHREPRDEDQPAGASGLLVRSIRNVVTAMATEATSSTRTADM